MKENPTKRCTATRYTARVNADVMSETLKFGNLGKIGFEVVERLGRLFLRYDAGAHQVLWREEKGSTRTSVHFSKKGSEVPACRKGKSE